MRFLVDNQLPVRLAAWFRQRGHECEHVADLGMEEADDASVWARVASAKAVVVSKDEDFIYLANSEGNQVQLVWVRLGNCRNAALIAAFEVVHDQLVSSLSSGQWIVEVR